MYNLLLLYQKYVGMPKSDTFGKLSFRDATRTLRTLQHPPKQRSHPPTSLNVIAPPTSPNSDHIS